MQIIKKTEKDSIRLLIGTFEDYALRSKTINNQINTSDIFFVEPFVADRIILWQIPEKEKVIPFNELNSKDKIIAIEKFNNSLESLNHDFDKYFSIPSELDIYVIKKKTEFKLIITQWGSEADDRKQKLVNIKKLFIENLKQEKDRQLKALKEKERLIKLAEQKKEQKQKENLIIPDNAENFEFAMGKWQSTSDLINSLTKEAVELFFEFDKNGNGTLTLNEASGNKCFSPLQLRLDNNTLHIEQLDEAKCNNNTHYVKHNIKCVSDNNNIAHCTAETLDGNKLIEFKLKKSD